MTNPAEIARVWIEEPCSECEGFGAIILGDFNDPSAPEVRCDNCEGSGTVDAEVECEAPEIARAA